MYKIFHPKTQEIKRLYSIDLQEIIPFVHWSFFFTAWRLLGEKSPEKEREKENLKRDAQIMLETAIADNSLKINAFVGIFPAHSDENDNIIIDSKVMLPMLRQQHFSHDGYCYALSDFVAAENDFVGFFATAVAGAEEIAIAAEKENDFYRAILVKTLADRLAEASAEWLHYKTRTQFWGYAADEKLSVEECLKSHYQGIRPAIGYPSLPDQSLIFEIDKLVDFSQIGISLTENGAMFPNASVAGLYFAHPKARYFMIGKIDERQLADYATRRHKTPQEMRKWLAGNL